MLASYWASEGVDCKISQQLKGRTLSIGERNECQRGRWALKGVDCEISQRLKSRTKHYL